MTWEKVPGRSGGISSGYLGLLNRDSLGGMPGDISGRLERSGRGPEIPEGISGALFLTPRAQL
jgi:hypothetical protein